MITSSGFTSSVQSAPPATGGEQPRTGKAPYHLGFTTLEHEARVDALPVEGSFPGWLTGTLFRTGPAKFEVGKQAYRHWFDGLAMLHRFTFNDGNISYANRYLQSRAYREAIRTGAISIGEFATDPCRRLFERVAASFSEWQPTDNGGINIGRIGDEFLAMSETRLPVRFDPRTLRALGVHDYGAAPGDRFTGPISTAHPHVDPTRNSMYSYVTDFSAMSRYRVFSIDLHDGRQHEIAVIPARKPAYMHSFGMSERYLILVEFPLVVNPLSLRFAPRPFIENYAWRPERGLRFHVIDKVSGNVVKEAHGDAVFAFHHVNAFESNGKLFVDMVAYPDASVISKLYLDQLRAPTPVTATTSLKRWRIDLAGSQDAVDCSLYSESIELPRINYERCAGQPYRYMFAVGNSGSGDFIDSLVKHDIARGESREWHEPGCYPGEPVFVAKPGAEREDEGVALSVVLDSRKETSFLLCLDATTWQERARAEAPHHIPFGFHGNYYSDVNLLQDSQLSRVAPDHGSS